MVVQATWDLVPSSVPGTLVVVVGTFLVVVDRSRVEVGRPYCTSAAEA